MNYRLSFAGIGLVVLVVITTAGTTGALWHDEEKLNPGSVMTGSLELLAGGNPESYVFKFLGAGNLGPGDSVSAPLSISNGGSAALEYRLENLITGSAGTTASAGADADLALALTLLVTNDATCDGSSPESGADLLYQGKLSTGSSAGRLLQPSSSETLCITVGLPETTSISASQGAVSATFVFRGDQVQ